MGWLSGREFRTLDRKMDRLLQMTEAILEKENGMSQALDDLATQVTANTTVEESAVTLIKGLAAQIAAAGTDPAKLQALQASLKASADDLAAAIAANTVAAPNNPPAGAQG
jgi:chromosome segregation ATPase